MTKTEKTEEKRSTKKVVCEHSKCIILSKKERLRLLSLMKTKLELKTFDEEIAAEVEDYHANNNDIFAVNENSAVIKSKYHIRVKRETINWS